MIKKVYRYWRIYGTRKLAKRIYKKLWMNNLNKELNKVAEPKKAQELLRVRFMSQSKLPVYSSGSSEGRVTLVTDSIQDDSFFGGVATALIFAILLSVKSEKRLRIVTRTAKGGKSNFVVLLEREKLTISQNVEFLFVDEHKVSNPVNYCSEDIFVTTSWWTTSSVMKSIPARNIIYVLQEDERMFYPYGDDRLRCAETIGSDDIRFLVNTRLLYDHLTHEGFLNVKENGIWFEPSFSDKNYYADYKKKDKSKYRLFFYSRPGHIRNLYYRGIEVLDNAILTGIIDLEEWDIYCIGSNSNELVFSNGHKPIIINNMSWDKYTEFIRTIDLGISLMYTPHPSYPPLDLAASGAVVITNKFGNKKSLDQYSKNILCTDLDVESLTETLKRGVDLVKDNTLRKKNYVENKILRNWEQSFSEALKRYV